MTTAKKATARPGPTKPAAAAPVPRSVASKATTAAAPAVASNAAPKVVTKPARKKSAPTPKPVIRTVKAVSNKKAKLVSDKFSLPKAEFAVLKDLKVRAGKLANPATKSGLIRAGIKALASMADAAFLDAVNAVPVLKADGKNKGKKA